MDSNSVVAFEESAQESSSSSTEHFSKTKLFEALYPLFRLMKFTGLFFIRGSHGMVTVHKRKGGCRNLSNAQVFASINVMLLWVNLFRTCAVIDGTEQFDATFLRKLIYISIPFVAAVNASCCFLGCYQDNIIPKLFRLWSAIPHPNPDVHFAKRQRKSHRISIGLAIYFVVFAILLGFYNLISPEPRRAMPVKKGDPFLVPFKIITSAFDFFGCAAWYVIMVIFTTFCSLLGEEFDEVNKRLEKVINDQFLLEERIGEIRQRHLKICELVDVADAFLSPYIAVTFVVSVAGICLIIYMFLTDTALIADRVRLLLAFVWMTVCITNLGIPFGYGAAMNSKAHASFSTMHRLRIEKVSQDFTVEVHLFLSRLSGFPIGFTSATLFVLDKTAILTTIGALVTYFLILLQFNTSYASACECGLWAANRSVCSMSGNVSMVLP